MHCRYTGADSEEAQYHKDSDCACGGCNSSPALREIKTLRTGFSTEYRKASVESKDND